MKDAVILLLCAAALADAFELQADPRLRTCNCNPSEAQQICEDNFGIDNVVIAHEYCDKFYLCSNGKPIAQDCPANLLYNPYLELCEWPDNVDCGDRPISDGTEKDDEDCDENIPDEENDSGNDNGNDKPCNCNPGEAPSICAAEGSNGILIAHQNCNQFYTCDQGRPVTFDCPPTLLYNPYNEECDWPQNVDCGDRIIPELEDDSANDDGNGNDSGDNDSTCNCNPEEAPAICQAVGSDGILIAHENCDRYYICNHGIPVATTCPNPLLFNPYTKQCDWAYNVDCGDRIVPDSGNGCSACNEGDDVSPPPCDESDNEDDESEELPPVGDDPGNDSDDTEKLPPVGEDSDDDSDDIDDGLPVTDNPGSDSVEVDVTPPSSSDPNDSENDNNGSCNCNPEEAPLICQADDSDGVLIAHENCNQFYKCDFGKPVAFNCSGVLLYNPHTEQCDWPENVDCGDRVIPEPDDVNEDSGNDTNESEGEGDDDQSDNNGGNDGGTCNCNPEEAPSICAADGSDGLLIAHENCNQFYICDHSKPVVLNCPKDLLYNPYTEKCDWPENVDCGDRVTPETDDIDEDSGNDDDSDDIDNKPPVADEPGSDSVEVDVTPPSSNDPDDSGNNNNGTCNCNPEEAPLICQTDGSDGLLIAHENCNQFYKCAHGKPVVLNCSGILLYNPYTEQCDWPENVDCGNRVVPDPDDVVEDSGNDTNENEGEGDDDQNDNNGGNDGGTCNCNPEEAPSICAADGSDSLLIAHENCNQFYICDHGKPVVLNCPKDLLYNPYTEQCDWPENVDCGDRVIPDKEDDSAATLPPVSEDSGNDNNSSEDGELPPGGDDPGNDNDADDNNSSDDGELPPGGDDPGNDNDADDDNSSDDGELPPGGDDPGNDNDADDDNSSDDGELPPGGDDPGNDDANPDDSDCDDNTDGGNDGTCNCDPDQAPSICAVDGSEGYLIAHEYCTHFYKCANGKPVEFKCGANLLYNPINQVCDWSSNVECGDRVIPEPDNDNNVSESEEVDDNVSENGNVTCNCNPEEAPAICAEDGSDGTQIAHENCNQFYLCSFGRPVAVSCPSSLFYNPYIQACDWPGNVQCGDRLIPDPEDNDKEDSEVEDNDNDSVNIDVNDDPSQAPAICAESGSDGIFVAHENCNQYYTCSAGSPVTLSCPDQLLFNLQINACDWANNVDCGDRIVPGNDNDCACNPRNAPALCAKPDSTGKLVAHENCNQFYMCVNGVPVARDCPANLHYNIDKEVCDWPQNVKCEMRMFSYTSLNKHLESRQALRK